jgi:arginyl-tRNA synthetase
MLRDQIRELLIEATAAAKADHSLPDVDVPVPEIMRPKQASHGDYSTNIALVLTSAVKKSTGEKVNPRQIGQAIADHIPQNGLVGKVELAGPGFINLHLSERWLQNAVLAMVQAGDKVGNIDRGQGQRWQVEFLSANPTGPVHFGGARNAVLGSALSNVLEAAGYDVQREFYVNDAGTQLQLFAETLYARYMQLMGQDVPIPEGGYLGDYMFDYARKVIESEGDRFVHMPPADAIKELKPLGREIVLDDLRYEVSLIGVTFDNWFSEQSLYDSGLVDEVLGILRAKGDIVERDGAVWFLASKYLKNMKDEVVIRSNGLPTYFASDIAYHYDKFVRRGFDTVVNVWAVDHQGHVPRMAAVMQALGLDPKRLIILLYDLVKLLRKGQEVKMSKRSGEFLTLREVVAEVGPDAVRFMLLTRSPESTIDFDLDLAVEESAENPVFYVQYSHARICSILAKARGEGFAVDELPSSIDVDELSELTHPSELMLIRKLLELEEQIDFAVDKLSPHNLTHYAIELARVFNGFYRDCKVVDADNVRVSRARLMLSMAARVVLARVLSLLGMTAPESM